LLLNNPFVLGADALHDAAQLAISQVSWYSYLIAIMTHQWKLLYAFFLQQETFTTGRLTIIIQLLFRCSTVVEMFCHGLSGIVTRICCLSAYHNLFVGQQNKQPD